MLDQWMAFKLTLMETPEVLKKSESVLEGERRVTVEMTSTP